jgi:formate dehydrogenase major subunit
MGGVNTDVIHLNINGREVTGFKGQTILEVARQNGIEIPTLCYDERVKIYGSCGLCVVEVEGSPKLFRACATEIMPGMVVFTDTPKVRDSRKLTLELLLSDHTGDCRPPCVKACPANTDCQGYVGLIANGQYREAVALIKEQLPLPASVGRVCPHPCEKECRRQLVEEPVSIAALKAFVGDKDLESVKPYMPEVKSASGKKAAIVGSGPAGLTAAYFLAKEGHAVTVYEAMPKPGGMLRYGIPQYRLPKEVLDKEIQMIEHMGVKFITNTRVGQDVTLEYLKRNNDVVFIGIGAWESSAMGCKGEDLQGVLGGIDFLREVATNGNVTIGDRVAVVGGGNTAMDAARTAVRLGAKQVMVLYRRTRDEMPAEDIEVKEAQEEGVEFKFLIAPLEVQASNGKITGIRMQKMRLGEPDASGRRKPVPIPGEEEVLPVDTVIAAIGQRVKPAGLDGVALGKRGTIAADEATFMTNIPGVFAGGDAVTGPKIAIEAVAQGKKAADVMISYLNGKTIPYKEPFLVEQTDLTAEDFADREKADRVAMPHLSPDERRTNFAEVNLGLSEEAAIAEAKRCLECGCRDYFECKLIKYANEYNVEPERLSGEKHREKLKEQHPFIERNSEKCILCGLCVRVCEEVMGVTALGLVHRGFETIVKPELNRPLKETDCIACGQCVTVCPTGALTERYPIAKNLPMAMESNASTCSFCTMCCGQELGTRGDMVVRALPKQGDILCNKGRFGFESFSGDRLTKPMIRKDGRLVETTWHEAFGFIAKKAQSIKSRYGSKAFSVFVSPAYTLEEANAAAEFGKKALGTDKLSTFTRNSARQLEAIFGENTSTNNLKELDATELILMVGSFGESQVAAAKIRHAAKNGAKLVIVSSEPSLADDFATLKIMPDNSTDILKQVLASVIKQNLTAKAYIEKNVIGFEEIKQALADINPSDEANKAAELYAKAKKAMIMVDGTTVTTAGVQLLAALALITGRVGSPRNGLIVILAGGNATGLWNVGIKSCFVQMTKALQAGEIKGTFILGEDPVGSGTLKPSDLKGLELLVVSTPFMTPTAESADVVLPGSTPLETKGTYIRADRKVVKVNRVKVPEAGTDNLGALTGLAAVFNVKLEPLKLDEEDTMGDPVKFADGFAFTDKKARLVMSEDTTLFDPVPTQDPALRRFNEKLQKEGLK